MKRAVQSPTYASVDGEWYGRSKFWKIGCPTSDLPLEGRRSSLWRSPQLPPEWRKILLVFDGSMHVSSKQYRQFDFSKQSVSSTLSDQKRVCVLGIGPWETRLRQKNPKIFLTVFPGGQWDDWETFSGYGCTDDHRLLSLFQSSIWSSKTSCRNIFWPFDRRRKIASKATYRNLKNWFPVCVNGKLCALLRQMRSRRSAQLSFE